MGQRHQSVGCVKVALKAAVVRLKRPEGEQDTPVDALFFLNTVEYGIVTFAVGAATVDTVV